MDLRKEADVADGVAIVTVDALTAAELDSVAHTVATLVQDRDDVSRIDVVVTLDDPLDAVGHLVEALDGQARHYGKRVDIRRATGAR